MIRDASSVELNSGVPKYLLVAAFHSRFKFAGASCYLFVISPLMYGIAFGWTLRVQTGVFGKFTMRLVRLACHQEYRYYRIITTQKDNKDDIPFVVVVVIMQERNSMF